jgi:hypothetical protein
VAHGALVRVPSQALPLRAGERRALAALAEQLAAAVVELLGSARPDRGFALHVAIARHHAALASLESGALQLLDPLPDDAPRVDLASEVSAAGRARLAVGAQGAFEQVRAATLAGEPPAETQLSLLEEAAARWSELEGAGAGRAVRHAPGPLVPTRARAVASAPLRGDVRGALAAARRSHAAQERALAQRFDYDVIQRNCMTELARVLLRAFDDPAAARAALGGVVEPGQGLSFVPWHFFAVARERMRIARVVRVPSFREREMAALEGWAALREATALTSSIDTPRRRDGEFLFFTSEDSAAPAMRPLLGAANLAYALAHLPLGLVAAPLDRGARLGSALRGALWSLPELALINVRKGTFEWVELEGDGLDEQETEPRP